MWCHQRLYPYVKGVNRTFACDKSPHPCGAATSVDLDQETGSIRMTQMRHRRANIRGAQGRAKQSFRRSEFLLSSADAWAVRRRARGRFKGIGRVTGKMCADDRCRSSGMCCAVADRSMEARSDYGTGFAPGAHAQPEHAAVGVPRRRLVRRDCPRLMGCGFDCWLLTCKVCEATAAHPPGSSARKGRMRKFCGGVARRSPDDA